MRKIFYLSDQHWKDINPVDFGWESCQPSHAFGPTARVYWLLHYVIQGKGIFETGGRRYPVHAGQMFVIRPWEITYYQADEQNPWEYCWLGFTASVALPDSLLHQAVIQANGLDDLFAAIQRAESMSLGREFYLCACIYQLLALLQSMQGTPNDPIEQAATYIASNYMKPLSVSEIAAGMNLNRSYFSKQFRQHTGLSPQQYLIQCRMNHAREMLEKYGFSPGEAALAVGYPDVFAFSRMYKRFYGVSPSNHRKRS